uniref:Uncharacterized protein n=1 Tax=Rhizophora mucronata TaxID=61149 RepID=A0A2P2LMS6_RHIMU
MCKNSGWSFSSIPKKL